MILREHFLKKLHDSLAYYPVCALLGPRQCGKTTLAHDFINSYSQANAFFDLEDPDHLEQLLSPKTTLSPLSGLIVIDEVQRLPQLFPYLRVLSDYTDKKFLLLGSASGTLLQQASESLTGRIDYLELTPFTQAETDNLDKHWFLGGFPKAYLAPNYEQSYKWRRNYMTSFIERDLPALQIHLNSSMFRHLWSVISHYHGQLVNYSDFARTLGTTDMTVRRYIQILSETFMVRLLKPWHENIAKRQVKTPKIYIRDSGLYHQSLGLGESDWLVHPKKGASFEGYVIEELIRHFGEGNEYYFWRTQVGEELDLLVIKNGKKYGFEIKFADAPALTKSMKTAIESLNLECLYVINYSDNFYQKDDKVYNVGIKRLQEISLEPIKSANS